MRSGHIVYLWERECSIQRRHQKVIEEAPSARFIERGHAQARWASRRWQLATRRQVPDRLARSSSWLARTRASIFLEMNTRLQVEHPVTEVHHRARSGRADDPCRSRRADLRSPRIRHQARRLGDGMPHQCRGPVPRLPADRPDGWSKFAPPVDDDGSSQTARCLKTGGVRVDTGVYRRWRDPDVLRLDDLPSWSCARAATGLDAIAKMREALNAFAVRGISSSNIPFQAALLAHPKFVARATSTPAS